MSSITLSIGARKRTLSGKLARFWAAMTAPARPTPRELPLPDSAVMNILRLNGGANSMDPDFLRHHIHAE